MATVCDIQGGKANISYPCDWEYKFFLEQGKDEKEFINNLFPDLKYEIKFSKENAKYKTFALKTRVEDEKERLKIFEVLKKNAKFVL